MAKYNYETVRRGIPVWACGYNNNVILKPVRGKIINNYFTQFKEGTDIEKFGGMVQYEVLDYTDTFDECVWLYNELICNRIRELNDMTAQCELDKL